MLAFSCFAPWITRQRSSLIVFSSFEWMLFILEYYPTPFLMEVQILQPFFIRLFNRALQRKYNSKSEATSLAIVLAKPTNLGLPSNSESGEKISPTF
jgi:hypothetical protein